MKLLGIDYGDKYVGIAVSDDDGTMAFPREVLPNDKNLLPHVRDLVANEHIGAIVMGESRDFHGEENPIMKRVHAFRQSLEDACGLPLYLEPELFSTKEARRPPDKDAGEGKGAERADASAAAIILQSFIDKQKRS